VTESSTFRVGTFNIRRAQDARDRVSLRGLARAVAALECDILGLQEVDRRRWRSRLRDESAVAARGMGGRRVFGPARVAGGQGGGRTAGRYGNALVARGRLHDVEVRPLPDAGVRQPRSATLARVVLDAGPEVSVAVTHLQHRPRELRDRKSVV